MYKFYDTSALIDKEEYHPYEQIIISSITLEELEHLKTSNNQTEEQRAGVRHALNLIDTNPDQVHYIMYDTSFESRFSDYTGNRNNDFRIILCAHEFLMEHPDGLFITNDRAQRLLAKNLLPEYINQIQSEYATVHPNYSGFKVVEPDDTVDVLKSKLYEQLRRNNWITKNTSEEDLKLSYGPKRLKGSQTLRELEIEDEDVITVNKTYFAA
jgi:hypothetical protein